MALEQLGPTAVAHLACAVGGLDNVGEEDGSEHSGGLRCWPDTRDEFFNLVQDCVAALGPP